jgi:hydrogenase-4 transcriptional activator
MSDVPAWLLQVWRGVSQHDKIDATLAHLLPLLRERLPAARAAILHLDLPHRRLELVAADGPDGVGLPRTRALDERQLEQLLGWAQRGTVLHGAAADGADAELLALVRPEPAGDVLAGPLVDAHGLRGLIVLASAPPQRFAAAHVELAALLLEPLAAALQNDRRVQEVSALREAAEADRLSLLRRLGRDGIVDTGGGAEGGLKPVIERVDIVAPSDLPVLILGETGSGKEVIARTIHERSPRNGRPFLRVNCGAIPPELIDSELFGHEKGSFTGAIGLRKGWFERADSGTLFLDEVGELPHAAQVRLLRVLQDGTFERVGGQHALTVDVRVIAATHPNLRHKVAGGAFREDLWYRIAVFPIELPPVRERAEDIPGLANHFAQRAARRFGFAPRTVTPEDLHLLLEYPWPGNVRELAAVMDRAAILGQGQRLEVAKALGMPLGPPPNGAGGAAGGRAEAAPVGADTAAGGSLRLDDAMRAHIEHVLRRTHGRIEGPGGAAELLAINPHTLRARMRKLRIDWARFRRPDAAGPAD